MKLFSIKRTTIKRGAYEGFLTDSSEDYNLLKPNCSITEVIFYILGTPIKVIHAYALIRDYRRPFYIPRLITSDLVSEMMKPMYIQAGYYDKVVSLKPVSVWRFC